MGWIRHITARPRRQISLAEQAAFVEDAVVIESKVFGDLRSLTHYPRHCAHYTLAQIAAVEWTAIEDALRRALTPALS